MGEYIKIGCMILICGFLAGCAVSENDSMKSDELKYVIKLEAIDAYPQNKAAKEDFTSVQDFAYKLFYSAFDAENPVVSPVSAYLASGMAAVGANGETKAGKMGETL